MRLGYLRDNTNGTNDARTKMRLKTKAEKRTPEEAAKSEAVRVGFSSAEAESTVSTDSDAADGQARGDRLVGAPDRSGQGSRCPEVRTQP